MALTLTRVADGHDVWGKTPVDLYGLTPDTSYPVGGYAISAANVGEGTIFGVEFVGQNTAALGYIPAWNTQTGKFQIIVSSTGVEATGNLSALTFLAIFICGVQI